MLISSRNLAYLGLVRGLEPEDLGGQLCSELQGTGDELSGWSYATVILSGQVKTKKLKKLIINY